MTGWLDGCCCAAVRNDVLCCAVLCSELSRDKGNEERTSVVCSNLARPEVVVLVRGAS